jgi:hypothetical protein
MVSKGQLPSRGENKLLTGTPPPEAGRRACSNLQVFVLHWESRFLFVAK